MNSKLLRKTGRGFTLLEVLLVVGLISILAGIVVVAINPTKQLKAARDLNRKVSLIEINKALTQYYIDNNSYPAGFPSVVTEICDTGSEPSWTGDCTGYANLSALVPTYLAAIPKDPQGAFVAWIPFTKIALALGGGTGFFTSVTSASSKTVYVEAANTELSVGQGLIQHIGKAPAGWTIRHARDWNGY